MKAKATDTLPLPSNPIFARKVRTLNPDDIRAETVLRHERAPDQRELRKLFRSQSASDFVGRLTPGCHLFCITKGQFSLVDVIREVTNQMPGPTDFALSTWTIADADLGELQGMLDKSRFARVRLLLDFSFQRRQPALIAHVRKIFSSDCICVTKNHCKFALFSSGAFRIVCRTSMNLNFNPRLEDVELTDDPQLHRFLEEILDDIFQDHGPQNQAGLRSAQLSGQFSAWNSQA